MHSILIQGRYVSLYTKNIIEHYFNIFPDVIICLSTWIEDKYIYEKELYDFKEKKNFILVESRPFRFSGYQNINLQIQTSYFGLKKLEEFGCKTVLKTRTDIKISNKNIFEYYRLTQSKHDKVLALETESLYKNLFFIPDFIFLGSLSALKKMFYPSYQITGDNRQLSANYRKLSRFIEYGDLFTSGINALTAERHLVLNYLRANGYVLPKSLFQMAYYWPILAFLNYELKDKNFWQISTLKRYNSLYHDSFTSYELVVLHIKNKYKFVYLFKVFSSYARYLYLFIKLRLIFFLEVFSFEKLKID